MRTTAMRESEALSTSTTKQRGPHDHIERTTSSRTGQLSLRRARRTGSAEGIDSRLARLQPNCTGGQRFLLLGSSAVDWRSRVVRKPTQGVAGGSERSSEGSASSRVRSSEPSFASVHWRPETVTAHFMRHMESPCRSRSFRATSSAGRINRRTRRAYRRFMRSPLTLQIVK